MTEKKDYVDVLKLGNELTTRRYLFNKVQVPHYNYVGDSILSLWTQKSLRISMKVRPI